MNAVLLLSTDDALTREIRGVFDGIPASPTLLTFGRMEDLEEALRTLGHVELLLTHPAAMPRGIPKALPVLGILAPGEQKPDGLPCLERPVRRVALQSMLDLLKRRPGGPTMAQARERALARFFSGIAHDINNRLTTLTGYISMMPEFVQGEDEMIEDMEVAADAAGDLVRQLQAFKDTDRLPPHPVDLTRTLNSLRDLSRRLVHPDTQLETAWPDPPLWIEGDPASLEFLIIGGLSWFAGVPQTVTLSAARTERGGVELAFTCGIPTGFQDETAWRRDRPVFAEVVARLGADWEVTPTAMRFHFRAAPENGI